MSQNPEHNGTGQQPESLDDLLREHDYEVGYRNPPKSTRFQKGQSGNPLGRPRKPKAEKFKLADAPADMYIEEEASRLVTVRERGKTYKIPAIQAVRRSQVSQALGGNRIAGKDFLEAANAERERERKSDEEYYKNLTILKKYGLQVMEECKRKNVPVPRDLVPHPDDIELGPGFQAELHGPWNIADVAHYEHVIKMRDHCVLRQACFDTALKVAKRPKNKLSVLYLIQAHIIDRQLPKRMQWPSDVRPIMLMCEYSRLSLRECARRVNEEWAHLKATMPRNDGAITTFAHHLEKCLETLFSNMWKSMEDFVEEWYASKKRTKPIK
jgi:hypothetical protein